MKLRNHLVKTMAEEIEFSVEDRSRYVRAIYAFEANDNTQLTIKEGDILEVFYRDDSGWWDGKNVATLDDGYFPGNYTEALGDNLEIIKQKILNEDEENSNRMKRHKQTNDFKSRSSMLSIMRERVDSSIDIRNAEPLIKRCTKCLSNECNLATIHCRSFCIVHIPFCSKTNKEKIFEYDAYIFRSLSIIQHTLCIFGAISINHFISSLITDIYDKNDQNEWILSNKLYIRCFFCVTLSLFYVIFLFLTSNTSLMFLKQSPNNQHSTNKRDRSKTVLNGNDCFRNFSLKCGKCGMKSCRPYTFIYTQFIMLLFCYILAFLWQDLSLDFQSQHILNSLKYDWWKNVIFLCSLWLLSTFCLFVLQRKLIAVYTIYTYYSREAMQSEVVINSASENVSRPYQVSLYLYFWSLFAEIIIFLFALPSGSCFAAFCFWILRSFKLCNSVQCRIICMAFYLFLFLIIFVFSWRIIHNLMKYKSDIKHPKELKVGTNVNANNQITRSRVSSIGSTVTMTNSNSNSQSNTNTVTESLLNVNGSLPSNLSSVYSAMNATEINVNNENELIESFESDIPDFVVLIAMKYYGAHIEHSEFLIIFYILLAMFFCDIFLIGFWFNLWMLFDDDSIPFDNEKHFDPSTIYLIYICCITLFLPFICSYLFGKMFAFICCKRHNYKLSKHLEGDKLWIKSLLSRWFIVIQSLLLGYLWCEYFESLWLSHIDTKYYTLSTGLMVIIIYFLIFFVIGICKLNKRVLRLLWTMHDEESKHKKEKKREAGVGNLGLNASIRELQLEKKISRRMISYKTKKANKAIVNRVDFDESKDVNEEEEEQIEIIKRKKDKKIKASGLSTSLLQSDDDDDDAQIL